MKCKLCIEDLNRFIVFSEKIGKIISVEGEDMTNEYFRTFNMLRRTIKKIEFEEIKNGNL